MSSSSPAAAGIRIGQMAEAVGVSTELLRAWERRYDLFDPARSGGGYRLYSPADVALARRVVALRDGGMPVGTAVDSVRRSQPSFAVGQGRAPELVAAMSVAAADFDEQSLTAAIDAALTELGAEGAIHDVLMPYLAQLGDDWANGRAGVAQEHFASHIIRRRVGALATDAASGAPSAVLACPPGELHDIPLLCLGVLMADDGWRVRYLGVNTPVADLYGACELLDPDLVVLSGSRRSVFEARAGAFRRLARRWPLMIGGRGAEPGLHQLTGARLLPPALRDAAVVVRQLGAELAGATA